MTEENVDDAPLETNPVSETAVATRPAPAKPEKRTLPPWNVLLHNDDIHEMVYVIETITMLTPLNRQDASQRMIEAHVKGAVLLLTTHKERAELYQEQFASRSLTVTIEPAP